MSALASTPIKFTAAWRHKKVILDLKSLTLDYTAEEEAIFPLNTPIAGFQLNGQKLQITCEVGKVRLTTQVDGVIDQKERQFILTPTNRPLPFKILHDLPGCIIERIWYFSDQKGIVPQGNDEAIPMLPIEIPNHQQKSKLIGKVASGTILTIVGSKAIFKSSKSSFPIESEDDHITLLCNLSGGRVFGQAYWQGSAKTNVFPLYDLPFPTTQAKSSCMMLDDQYLIQPDFGWKIQFNLRSPL